MPAASRDEEYIVPSQPPTPRSTSKKRRMTSETLDNEPLSPAPKRRRLTSDALGNDSLPAQYRHIRKSIHKVRPEFYRVVDKLKSKFHCTTNQAIGAVVEVGNAMFDADWKYHDECTEDVDLDTVPHTKNIRESGKAITVLTLASLVDLVMDSDSESVISYHDDGSRKQGIGGYSVQGITINGIFRPLPTLPIASESRENLAALKLAVLNMLCVCNPTYTPVQIQEAITFKITDSTSHNLGVEELVSLELGTDYIPEQLLCHTHPVLMFTRVFINFVSGMHQILTERMYAT